MRILIALALTLAMASSAPGQGRVDGYRGPVFPQVRPRLLFDTDALWQHVPVRDVPVLDVQAQRDASNSVNGRRRVGVVRTPADAIDLMTAGSAIRVRGGVVRRLAVRMANALAVNMRVRGADLIQHGGELRVADASLRVVHRLNASKHRDAIWTAVVPGAVIFIEAFVPDDYRGAVLVDRVGGLFDTEFTHSGTQRGLLACQEDVMCYAVDPIARDAVARLLFASGPGLFVCTGTLLADNDAGSDLPFLLTAHHCISTFDEAASLTAYWFYQTDTCDGSVPGLAGLPQSTGATILETDSGTDVSLLLLDDPIVDGQGFAGWTTDLPADQQTVMSIHHPSGSYKRYSEGVVDFTPITTCGGLPLSSYWYGHWTLGVTEGGSSGSPLFDENWHVIGQLFGKCCPGSHSNESPCDLSDCTNRDEWNWVYGRFDQSFALLEAHLNGSPQSEIWVDFSYEGGESGTFAAPYNTLAEAVAAAGPDGLIMIKAGSSSETLTIDPPGLLTITSFGGTVRIGD